MRAIAPPGAVPWRLTILFVVVSIAVRLLTVPAQSWFAPPFTTRPRLMLPRTT